MKKIVIILGLLSILTTMSSASVFISSSYGQSLENTTFTDDNNNDISFENAKFLNVKIGATSFPVEEIDQNYGGYLGLDVGLGSDKTTYIYNGNTEELEYKLKIFTLGITYTLNNNIVLLGGPGLAMSTTSPKLQGKTSDKDDSSEYNYSLNLNGGVIVYLLETHFGIIAEYNSVPNAVSVGLAMRF